MKGRRWKISESGPGEREKNLSNLSRLMDMVQRGRQHYQIKEADWKGQESKGQTGMLKQGMKTSDAQKQPSRT